MNFIHLIYIPFRGVGIRNGDDAWFAERIEIFKQYTLKSLLNQTNRDFILWLSFRPEDKGSELMTEFSDWLANQDFDYICTFEGLMYHDDKNLVANDTLEQRLDNSLIYLAKLLPLTDYVILTRLDSDDMLHKDAVGEIQANTDKASALVFMRGLVYNTDTGEVCEWRPRTCPPFQTLIFPKDTFFDAKKHLEFYGDWQSHEDTILCFPFYKLSDHKYCVTVRPEGHISTTWNHQFRGKPMDKSLLKDFGC